MIYSLLLDEARADVPRSQVRETVDEQLLVPLEPDEREAFERERFGLRPEDLRAAEGGWDVPDVEEVGP